MARNTNTNLAPGGGGGTSRVKVSPNVTVKAPPPVKGLNPREVARLKAINAQKADPNKSRTKSATKAANKDVVKKILPGTSKAFGMPVLSAPKQVSKTAAAKNAAKTAEVKAAIKAKAVKTALGRGGRGSMGGGLNINKIR
jgi:hypothetical protein